MTKKLLKLGLITLLIAALIVGCNSNNNNNNNNESNDDGSNSDAMYQDGMYFAIQDEFNEETGWKYAVTLEVKDGEITSVDWNGVSIEAGMTKKELSKEGLYKMVEFGGAIAPWYEQAELTEAYLLESQSPTSIEYQDDNYHTDAITGVTIGVSPLFSLAEQALEAGPQEPGPYKDGAYYAEEDEFSEKSGFKYNVSLTVLFGNIESVNWNATHKDGGDDKKTLSANGEYGMVENGGAQSTWIEQARLVEAYLLETQDPTDINYLDDNYKTDAITGVSIGVSPFFTLAEKALEDAK